MWYGIGSALALIEQPVASPAYRVNAGRLGESVAEMAMNLRTYMPEIVRMFSVEEVQRTLLSLEALEDMPLRA